MTYGSNPTDTITGVIIYPDDFTWENAGINPIVMGNVVFGLANYSDYVIDPSDWVALEEAGCIFLPSSSIMSIQTDGSLDIPNLWLRDWYWSNRYSGGNSANYLQPTGYNTNKRNSGLPVRLVKNVE